MKRALAWIMRRIRGEYELPPFKPAVYYHEAMRFTEMILEDVACVSVPLELGSGHAVDLYYAMDNGRLIGIRIWDDVRLRPKSTPLRTVGR